jgi:hypothetical protein
VMGRERMRQAARERAETGAQLEVTGNTAFKLGAGTKLRPEVRDLVHGKNRVMARHVQSAHDSSVDKNAVSTVWPARDDFGFRAGCGVEETLRRD